MKEVVERWYTRIIQERYLLNRPVPEQQLAKGCRQRFGERRTDGVSDEAVDDSGNSMWIELNVKFKVYHNAP
jgi:hypothetical protein